MITIVLGTLLVSGCRRQSSPPVDSAAVHLETAEIGWEQQVSAVRQGQSSKIRMQTQSVNGEQWSALSDGCEHLAVLDVEALEIPQASLSLLADLPELRQLRIGSAVGDDGVHELARVRSLEVLNLPQGEFTDAGLAELTALPGLELLRFHSPYVTDTGMQHVAKLPALRFLHLIDVPITDAGLMQLDHIQDLESFYLDGGNCTDEGLSRLLKELPQLHFHYNQLHLPGDPHAHPHEDSHAPH